MAASYLSTESGDKSRRTECERGEGTASTWGCPSGVSQVNPQFSETPTNPWMAKANLMRSISSRSLEPRNSGKGVSRACTQGARDTPTPQGHRANLREGDSGLGDKAGHCGHSSKSSGVIFWEARVLFSALWQALTIL